MGIRITAKRDGFRRCGIAHLAKGKTYADDFFTPEQLDVLKREPQLVVTEGVELEQDGSDEIDSANLQPAGAATAPQGAAPAAPAPATPAAAAKAVKPQGKAAKSAGQAGSPA